MLFHEKLHMFIIQKERGDIGGTFYLMVVLSAKPRFSCTPKRAGVAIVHAICIGKAFGVFGGKTLAEIKLS